MCAEKHTHKHIRTLAICTHTRDVCLCVCLYFGIGSNIDGYAFSLSRYRGFHSFIRALVDTLQALHIIKYSWE